MKNKPVCVFFVAILYTFSSVELPANSADQQTFNCSREEKTASREQLEMQFKETTIDGDRMKNKPFNLFIIAENLPGVIFLLFFPVQMSSLMCPHLSTSLPHPPAHLLPIPFSIPPQYKLPLSHFSLPNYILSISI